MKTYKMTERRIIEPKQVIGEISCDLCQQLIKDGTWEVSESTVSVKSGNNFGGDGGDLTTLSIDICELCFKNKLMPLIENTFDVEFQEKETSW